MRTAKPNLLLTAAGFSTKNSRIMASTDDEAEIDSPSIMPTSFEAPFLQTLLDRGFIHQCTDFKTLDDKMSSQIVPAYLGFDATASSLHVGSLLQI